MAVLKYSYCNNTNERRKKCVCFSPIEFRLINSLCVRDLRSTFRSGNIFFLLPQKSRKKSFSVCVATQGEEKGTTNLFPLCLIRSFCR